VSSTQDIAGQISLRADPKYRFFWDVERGLSIPSATMPQVRLRDCLLPYHARMIQKGELTEERRILELADVEARTSLLLDEEGGRTVTVAGSAKLDFADCDLVVTRLRPYLGKVVLNDIHDPFIGTSEWIPLKLRRERLDPMFAKYVLLTPQCLTALGRMMGGKEHPRTREDELTRLRIPFPPFDIQCKVAKQIDELEKQLVQKHRGLTTRAELIDAVFADELGYAQSACKGEGNHPVYECAVHGLGRSLDLRCGVRFHNPKFNSYEIIFANIERCRFRDVVVRPLLRLGSTIDPDKHYDDDGQAYYVSPAVIKTYVFNFGAARTVSDEYYEENVRHSGLCENDVVVARSGEGTIGKPALYAGEEPCIHGDFTMRIRFNDRIDPEFGYYFCCSALFQFQVEKCKRGMGNMTNFFPSQLLTFWIACPSMKRQKQIAQRVRDVLASLEAEKAQVKQLRDTIDTTVLQSVQFN
jgi:restriction endonuclease S subunit